MVHSSSMFFSSKSASFHSSFPRVWASTYNTQKFVSNKAPPLHHRTLLHSPSNAWRAALTALSTSALSHSDTWGPSSAHVQKKVHCTAQPRKQTRPDTRRSNERQGAPTNLADDLLRGGVGVVEGLARHSVHKLVVDERLRAQGHGGAVGRLQKRISKRSAAGRRDGAPCTARKSRSWLLCKRQVSNAHKTARKEKQETDATAKPHAP
jgi:hypothetical protein